MSTDKSEEKKVLGLTKKQRSHLYTVLFIIVFLIFFFVNNSFEDAGEGPLPPNYEAKINPSSRTEAAFFELPSTTGDIISLNNYNNTVLVLNFWASWSEPCRKELSNLIELKKEFAGKDFEIIGIALDTDTKENVPKVVEQAGINYPVVYGTMSTAKSYGDIRSIPTTFILDKKGRIYTSYVGDTKPEVFKNDINKLLGE